MPNKQNLKAPWPKGTTGNPAGRKKGSKNLATFVREFLENPIDWSMIPVKGSPEFGVKYKSKPAMAALVHAAFADALSGSTGRGQARDWLRKSGYGEKLDLDLTSGGKPIPLLAGLKEGKKDASRNDRAQKSKRTKKEN